MWNLNAWLEKSDKTVKPAADRRPPMDILQGFAWFVAMMAIVACAGSWAAFINRDMDYRRHDRFKGDNAVGATANATESIKDSVQSSTPYFGYALLALVIVALERLRTAVHRQSEILLVGMVHRKQPDEAGGGKV